MYGFPRSRFHLQAQYGSRRTIPFHTGLYGATIQPPMPPHSYFGIPTNGSPTAVQEYLDINCNQSYGESRERVSDCCHWYILSTPLQLGFAKPS